MSSLTKIKKQFIIQHGQSDCGPACFLSIIKYHGGDSSLDEIRRVTGTTKLGTKLLGLYQGAKPMGFDAEGMEAEGVHNLKELDHPAILHVVIDDKLLHYVVFYGFADNQLIIGDPAKGIELWSEEKLEKAWQSKTLLTLRPSSSFVKSQSKSEKYNLLLKWVKEDINILLAALFLGTLIAIFSLATAVFSQKLIDVILPTKQVSKLAVGLCLFAFILLIGQSLSYVRSTFLITQSKDFNNRMTSSFFNSLLDLPKSFFDAKKTGEMIARMNDTRRIQTVLSNLIGNLLIECLVILVSIIGVFVYSWKIGVVLLCFIPIYILVLWRFNTPIINSQKEVMSSYALNEGNYIDVISGISEVKSSSRGNLFHRLTTGLYFFFQQKVYDLGKIQIRFNFQTELLGALLIITVISVSSYMVLQDQLMLGVMMAVLSLSSSIGPSLTRIALFNIQVQEAKVAFDRMQEFTGLQGEESTGSKIETINTLELRELNFNFPGSLSLLTNLTMKISKGQVTTLLGESGAGKSTISQLLQRFYKPTTGDILADNTSIFSLDLSDYRQKIGVVPQDIKIFNNYLPFNIALSDDPKEFEKAMNWCNENGFGRFFSRFPQGYNTLLGEEGANISGGQKQLVALARALYSNPEVLIIDEGTSAMDKNTESFILKIIQERKQTIAVLMITHRKKIAKWSDYIYIIEKATIQKNGTPTELEKYIEDME